MTKPGSAERGEGGGREAVLPSELLWAMGLLALISAGLAFVARVTGVGTVPEPRPVLVDERASRAAVIFDEERGGGLRVVDATSGEMVASVPPGSGGFVRGVLRPLARERMRRGHGMELPLYLIRDGSGRLILRDPHADLTLRLAAFGPSSVEAFEVIYRAAIGPTGAQVRTPPPEKVR